MTRYVVGFDAVGKNDTELAGGKGANLGELTQARLPVPPGFIVIADAYRVSMEQGGIREVLRAALDSALEVADHPDELATACDGLQWLVRTAGVPQEIQAAVPECLRLTRAGGPGSRPLLGDIRKTPRAHSSPG